MQPIQVEQRKAECIAALSEQPETGDREDADKRIERKDKPIFAGKQPLT